MPSKAVPSPHIHTVNCSCSRFGGSLWNPWEDEIIRNFFSRNDVCSVQSIIPMIAPMLPHRTPVAIRHRAYALGFNKRKYLSKNLTSNIVYYNGGWSEVEDSHILKSLERINDAFYKPDYKYLMSVLPNRSNQAIRNRYQSLKRRVTNKKYKDKWKPVIPPVVDLTDKSPASAQQETPIPSTPVEYPLAIDTEFDPFFSFPLPYLDELDTDTFLFGQESEFWNFEF